MYGVGGGGGVGGWAAGVASPAHTDGSSDPGTGAGGGGAHLNTWAGGPQQYGGGAAGTYGGAGATSNQTGTDGSSGHGGGKVVVSPTTGTNAAGINTNQGTLNDYEEGSDLPYACGGGGVRSEGGGVFVAGYPTADYDHGSGRTGRIAGGYGGQGDTSKRSANQNTGGGGCGYYGATSGRGAAGIFVVRVAV